VTGGFWVRSKHYFGGMSSRATANRKVLIVLASIAGLAILAFIAAVLLTAKPRPPVDGEEILWAVRQFCGTHHPLPTTVTFSQLIAEGYLRTNVLQDFGASEVTVYLNADETSPQMPLMDALMPDGSHTHLMADGSVQGSSKSRFQQATATNGSR
jgi:hypothetical protein